jgi:hypothetical protein
MSVSLPAPETSQESIPQPLASAGHQPTLDSLRSVARRMQGDDRVVATILGLGVTVLLLFAAAVAVWYSQRPKETTVVELVPPPPSAGFEGEGGDHGDTPGADGKGVGPVPSTTFDTVDASDPPPGEQTVPTDHVLHELAKRLEEVETISGPLPPDDSKDPDGKPTKDGPPGDRLPRSARWSFRFGGSTVEEYSAMLDHFGIELGAVKGTEVRYVSKFSAAAFAVRGADPAQPERRFFCIWAEANRKAIDARLLQAAGVSTDGAIIALFLPDVLTAELERIEKAFANRPVQAISRTEFKVVPRADGGFEWRVESQRGR